MPFESYFKSEAPEHWVVYIRHSESLKIVWDRRDYTELIDDLDVVL